MSSTVMEKIVIITATTLVMATEAGDDRWKTRGARNRFLFLNLKTKT